VTPPPTQSAAILPMQQELKQMLFQGQGGSIVERRLGRWAGGNTCCRPVCGEQTRRARPHKIGGGRIRVNLDGGKSPQTVERWVWSSPLSESTRKTQLLVDIRAL